MIAFTFIFFIKVTELKKKDQARGGGEKKKFACTIGSVHSVFLEQENKL